MGLLQSLEDGKKREISEEEFDYFLNVLPPAVMRFTWAGERWSFGFAEGNDFIYAFKRQDGKCYAQKTDLMNPHECGGSLEEQLQRLHHRQAGTETISASRAASWIPTWIKIGNANPWIRRASDPPFNTQSFHECANDDELLDKLSRGNWSLGQAFYVGDLCFIQQVEGGEEWLTIKQGVAFDSISFGRIMRDKGRGAGQALLDGIRMASVEACRALEY
jgi:hypothetical protein